MTAGSDAGARHSSCSISYTWCMSDRLRAEQLLTLSSAARRLSDVVAAAETPLRFEVMRHLLRVSEETMIEVLEEVVTVGLVRRGDDAFTSYLFDIGGLGTKGIRGRMSLPDESLLPYIGLIAQKPHSCNALENVLSDYFGTPAKIKQFFGQWLALDSADYTRLGERNSLLGESAIAGTKIWEQQSKFRVRLGSLTFKQFQNFLPNGSAFKPLKSIIHFMVGEEFDFDVQLILKSKQVPGAILTTRAQRKPMLGWTTFLKTKPFKTDDEQVVLQMDA